MYTERLLPFFFSTETFAEQKAEYRKQVTVPGKATSETLGEVMGINGNTLTSSREENYSICVDVIEEVKKQIKVVASEPIEDDFDAAFAVLKVIEHPTKAEIQAVIERYRHNYLAYRAICALFDNNQELCSTITIDEVLDACDELSDMLHRCFYGGEGIDISINQCFRSIISANMMNFSVVSLQGILTLLICNPKNSLICSR